MSLLVSFQSPLFHCYAVLFGALPLLVFFFIRLSRPSFSAPRGPLHQCSLVFSKVPPFLFQSHGRVVQGVGGRFAFLLNWTLSFRRSLFSSVGNFFPFSFSPHPVFFLLLESGACLIQVPFFFLAFYSSRSPFGRGFSLPFSPPCRTPSSTARIFLVPRRSTP